MLYGAWKGICFCGKATAHMIQKQIKEGCETYGKIISKI